MRLLFKVILFCSPVVCLAQDGLGAFGSGMGRMGFGSSSGSSLSYTGSNAFGGGNSSVGYHRLNAGSSLYETDRESYSLAVSGSSLQFGDAVVLTRSGTSIPANFYRFDVGGQYLRNMEEGTFGTRLTVGSASDKPFSSSRDVTFSAFTHYIFAGEGASNWMIFVFMSNNTNIANYIPIPGFVYNYATPKFVGLFGLPFAWLKWMPAKPWAFSLSLFGPNFNSEVSYGHKNEGQGFGGFSWSQQSYLRHDREFEKDRLFLGEAKAYLGIRKTLNEKLSSELQGGYSFNRVVYEGPRFEKRDRGSADLDDAWHAGLNLNYML